MPTNAYVVFGKDIALADITALLPNVFANDPLYYCLRGVGDCVFGRVEDRTQIQDHLKIIPEGELFNEKVMLRWWKQDDNTDYYEIQFLTEDDTFWKSCLSLNTIEDWSDDFVLPAEDKDYYLPLWGRYSEAEDGWIESKIPQKLTYPIDKKEEIVELICVKYCSKQTGAIQFLRWKGVK